MASPALGPLTALKLPGSGRRVLTLGVNHAAARSAENDEHRHNEEDNAECDVLHASSRSLRLATVRIGDRFGQAVIAPL